jgi:hypothetical protein
MSETEAFALSAPSDADLDVAERAWHEGHVRYTVRSDDVWYRVLKAPTPDAACEYAAMWYPTSDPGRFTPLVDAGGIMSTAYAASTRSVAIWEVILRNSRHRGLGPMRSEPDCRRSME